LLSQETNEEEVQVPPPSYDHQRFTALVYDADLEKARELATEKGLPVSVILRDAIKAGLAKEKK
jgi:hypothetical protein